MFCITISLLQSYFALLTSTPYKHKLLCENRDRKVKCFDRAYVVNSQQNWEYNLIIPISNAKMLCVSKHSKQ